MRTSGSIDFCHVSMSGSDISVNDSMFACCSQERLTKMWFVSGVPMGRSLIRSPTRTAVGLIQSE